MSCNSATKQQKFYSCDLLIISWDITINLDPTTAKQLLQFLKNRVFFSFSIAKSIRTGWATFFKLSSNDPNTQLYQKSDIYIPEDLEKEDLRDITVVHTDDNLLRKLLQVITAMD